VLQTKCCWCDRIRVDEMEGGLWFVGVRTEIFTVLWSRNLTERDLLENLDVEGKR